VPSTRSARPRLFSFIADIPLFADHQQLLITMATQNAPSILFTNTQPQQGFRLLEIPPELEELLTSKDAPA